MKKFAFAALLSVSVAMIAVANTDSQQSNISANYITNIADTAPLHHHSTIHKTIVHKKTVVKKPVKDSTKL